MNKRMTQFNNNQKGFTAVMMLIFVIICMTIATTATMLIVTGTMNVSMFQEGLIAYQMAENGAENAVMRLLRDTNYTGETYTVNEGTVQITITGTNPKTVTSSVLYNKYQRKIQLSVTFTNGVLSVSSWREIF